ncbi:oxygenase MpaB family protein [uncultured Sphingomonas sp.]|uniref:oxygenase MpaB family protein n=1 Tax=uncultured Sphingomonas sp. TaxID=158754 RepID=UPI0035CC8EC6
MNPLRDTIRGHVHRLVKAEAMDLSRPPGDPGLFGEASEAGVIHGDFSAMLIGGVAALLTQMLHPLALAGVWDHSDWRDDPGGRLARTARFIALTTYGATAAAEASLATVRRIHDRVTGMLPDGTPYRANDPALLTWVHAVEADGFLRAHVAYREPGMPGPRQDRYLAEMAGLARRLGATDVPESRRALAGYFRAVRPQLRYDERTQTVAATLLAEAGARDGLGVAIGQVLMTAGVELMQPWAAAMHGLGTPALRRPAIRAGAAATAGVLRWALSG